MFGVDGAALDEVALALAGESAMLPCDVPGAEWPQLGELSPGPETAERLARLPVTELDEYDLVEAVAGWERLAAFAHAGQVAAMAALARRPMFAELSSLRDGIDAARAVALEVSARLGISVREAQRRVELAQELAEDRPATLAALRGGQIDYWRAVTIAEEVRVADSPIAARVEAQILPAAGRLSRSGLRAALEKAVLAADPAAGQARHEHAVADRQVRCRPEADGMGSVWALLPAADTWVLDQVLDAAADGMKTAEPADARPHAQRRADALAQMAWAAWHSGVIGDPDTGTGTRLGRRRRAEVAVIVPFSTLIGLDDHPGQLVGYGPVPAEVARRIAAEGTWRRLLTDPATGRVLDYGTTRYRPPQHLIDHVRMRDQTCRGIGCTRLARSCDIDHTRRYPDGPTSAANTGPECRPHHNGITHGHWHLDQPEPGLFHWRSPTGHTYTRPPEQVGPIITPDTPADDPATRATDPDPPPF